MPTDFLLSTGIADRAGSRPPVFMTAAACFPPAVIFGLFFCSRFFSHRLLDEWFIEKEIVRRQFERSKIKNMRKDAGALQ